MDPLAILARMCKALDSQATRVALAEKWYSGDHPLPEPPPNTIAAHDAEARRAFTAMSKLAITNFLPAVADVPSAKLRIEGFRFSGSPTQTDAEAWAIWQRNFLDSDSDLANQTAISTGQAYVLVWADSDGMAEITVEHPSQAIIWYEAGSRRRRKAGLKRWVGDDGYDYANLYMPDAIYKFRSSVPVKELPSLPASRPQWEPRAVDGEPWPLASPLGVVSLVELRANASLDPAPFGGGVPEFTKQINDQRRINQTVMNMLVTMEHQSFRQRWVTGWGAPTLENGTPDKTAIMKASAAALWAFDDPDVKVGDFAQADFRPFIDTVTAWVKVIASTSGTPPYAFLLGDMINVAADSLARIEGILTSKVRAHSRRLGEAWEEVLRIALLVEGNEKASDIGSSVVWADFEERTATEQAALATTLDALGAPKTAVYSALPGVDQQEAARWAAEQLATDLLFPVP